MFTHAFGMRKRFIQSFGVSFVLLMVLAAAGPTGHAAQNVSPPGAPQDPNIPAVQQAECLAFVTRRRRVGRGPVC